jgi:hypothetical protein
MDRASLGKVCLIYHSPFLKLVWRSKVLPKQHADRYLESQNASQFTMTFELSEPSSLLCSDFYLFATVSGLQIKSFFFHGTHTITWELPADARASEVWDINTKGAPFRILASISHGLMVNPSLISCRYSRIHLPESSADSERFVEHCVAVRL